MAASIHSRVLFQLPNLLECFVTFDSIFPRVVECSTSLKRKPLANSENLAVIFRFSTGSLAVVAILVACTAILKLKTNSLMPTVTHARPVLGVFFVVFLKIIIIVITRVTNGNLG